MWQNLGFIIREKTMSVVFRHGNEEFVLARGQIVLDRYHREFADQKVVELDTKVSHDNVKQFFEFLKNGEVPVFYKDQIQVFQLLKEWDCHFGMLDSFKVRIQSLLMNGFISNMGVRYPINIGCLCFHSSVFQEFCSSHENQIYELNFHCSPKSIEVFLHLVHNRIKLPELEYIDEVLEICRLLRCSSLGALINENSPESILSTILRKQNEESFDSLLFEESIYNNIESFLKLSGFGQVCIPLLCRVFQQSKSILPIAILKPFLKYCIGFHGSKAYVLISMIKVKTPTNMREFSDFLRLFADNDKNDVFHNNSSVLDDFMIQFEKNTNENDEKENTIQGLINKVKSLEM